MNEPKEQTASEALPTSYAEAVERLEKSSGGRRTYRNMSYVLKGARVMTIVPRFRQQRVRNPARQASLWAYLTADEYVWTSVPDLGELYVDGKQVGRLHGHSGDEAVGVAAYLKAAGPQDVVINGHFTESGWFVDSVTLPN